MRYTFIRLQLPHYPVIALCRVMRVSTSAYYDWYKRLVRSIDNKTWQLCQHMKTLFIPSRASLVNRALMMAINLRQPPKNLLHHSDRG